MIAGRRLIGAAKALVPTRFRPKLRHVAERHGFVEPLPAPFRYPFRELVRAGSPYYPNYLWGTLCAAAVAATLGYDRISVIEFGVAGGNGLVALESCARQAAELSGVAIDTYGFDTGTGLPKPTDHRDLPQLWSEGFFAMDTDRLRTRLTDAHLQASPSLRSSGGGGEA